MPKVNFGDQRKQAEASGLLGGGDYLKHQEGPNRLRLMSACIPHADTFKGERNFKWLCYVVDRRDAKLKAYFMPHTVYKQIEALQSSEDYHFEDVPMPYDLTINAVGAGTKEVKYTVIPAKRETPITALENQALAEAKSLTELQQALKDKKGKERPPEPEQHENVDENGEPYPF